MLSSANILAYSSAIDGLSTLATRDVKSVLDSLEGSNPIEFRDALVAALPDVLDPYGNLAGEVAAQWYMELREASGVVEIFESDSLLSPDRERSEVLARWAVAPLFAQSDSTVLSLLSGGVQRLISGVGRDTIQDNILRDPVRVGYSRIPRPGCCSFCGMLASRGAVYASAESAGGVVGRGVSAASTAGKVGGQGKGVKARGSLAVGSTKYHDHCHCVAAPVFVGDTYHKEIEQTYTAMYEEAIGTKLSEYSGRGPEYPQVDSVDGKATLANWREMFGTK